VLGRVVALALMVIAGVAVVLHIPREIAYLNKIWGISDIGRDLEVVCTSLQALSIGHDPYLESKPKPLPYPVLHVYLWEPLCAVNSNPIIYLIVFMLIAAVSAIMLWRIVPPFAFDRIVVFVAIFLGFDSFKWQLASGNAAIIELPLAVAVVLLLAERRYHWAGIVFGFMASLKLLPFFGAFAFLFLPESNRLRLRTIAFASGSFLAVHALNAALFAQWLPSYAVQLIGRLPGGRFYEPGGHRGLTQDTIDLVVEGFRRFGIDEPLPGFVIACLGLGMACLASLACARKAPGRAELPPVAVVSLVMLILWLFLFRLKPYSFETFIPFIIAAGYSIGRNTAMIAIALTIIVPSAFKSHAVNVPVLPAYYQLVAAWAAVLALLSGAIIQLRWRSHPAVSCV
jgi:Glycosyltransferase family 87